MRERLVAVGVVGLALVFVVAVVLRERKEVVKARAEVQRLKVELRDKPAARSADSANPVVSMLSVAPRPVVSQEVTVAEVPAPRPERIRRRPEPQLPPQETDTVAEREKWLDQAADAWQIRSSLAKQQWFDRLKLSPEQQADFDEVLKSMNEAVGEICGEFAGLIEESGDVASASSSEMMWRVLQATSGAVVEAYDGVGNVLSPEQNGESRDLNLMEFIDPNAARPLLKHNFNGGAFGGARRGR